MPLQIPPLGDVAAMVFAAWTAGIAAGAVLTRRWQVVGAGHFKVVWLVAAAIAVPAALTRPAMWAVVALSMATFVTVRSGRDRAPGAATAVAALALAVADSGHVATTAASAVLLGGVSNAMLLGHWHLNQPKLGTDPIRRLVYVLWAGIALFAAASGWLAATSPAAAPAVAALAMVGVVAVLTAMVTSLVRTRSIMSATGILYLAILLCFVGVFTTSLTALS